MREHVIGNRIPRTAYSVMVSRDLRSDHRVSKKVTATFNCIKVVE